MRLKLRFFFINIGYNSQPAYKEQPNKKSKFSLIGYFDQSEINEQTHTDTCACQ